MTDLMSLGSIMSCSGALNIVNANGPVTDHCGTPHSISRYFRWFFKTVFYHFKCNYYERIWPHDSKTVWILKIAASVAELLRFLYRHIKQYWRTQVKGHFFYFFLYSNLVRSRNPKIHRTLKDACTINDLYTDEPIIIHSTAGIP